MNKGWCLDVARLWVCLLGAGGVSCAAELEEPGSEVHTKSLAVSIPSHGSASTLDLAEWNIEWFGSTSNGPTNESLQLSNVRDVIAGSDFDIWALEEVVSQAQFNSLEAQLPGYVGFTSAESTVTSGASYYTASEQKLAILYKSSLATLLSAKLILTQNDYDFAGRPPLEVKLRVTINGVAEDLVVIVVHLKAFDDVSSWQRRQNAANALKSYLDSTYPTQRVAVLGDFNDDLDVSITQGQPTPFGAFIGDPARYTFPSRELTNAGIATTVSYPDAVDHHLASNELYAEYVASSVDVYRVDELIPSYGTTTSDHFPVESHYSWTGLPTGGGGAEVILNEILANETGSNTAGEFVELVNIGDTSANLSGWTLRDASAVRHTFASGTTLLPGKALVVFGGSSAIPAGLTNAIGASTGSLSLSNSGDTVSLRNASATTIDGFTYGSSLANLDGVSMNLSPDADAAGSFVRHTVVSSLSSSAGKRASGAAF